MSEELYRIEWTLSKGQYYNKYTYYEKLESLQRALKQKDPVVYKYEKLSDEEYNEALKLKRYASRHKKVVVRKREIQKLVNGVWKDWDNGN